jgi:hypothetical protein
MPKKLKFQILPKIAQFYTPFTLFVLFAYKKVYFTYWGYFLNVNIPFFKAHDQKPMKGHVGFSAN